MNFLGKYMQIKKRNAKIAWKKAEDVQDMLPFPSAVFDCVYCILHFARADVSILQFHVL